MANGSEGCRRLVCLGGFIGVYEEHLRVELDGEPNWERGVMGDFREEVGEVLDFGEGEREHTEGKRAGELVPAVRLQSGFLEELRGR